MLKSIYYIVKEWGGKAWSRVEKERDRRYFLCKRNELT